MNLDTRPKLSKNYTFPMTDEDFDRLKRVSKEMQITPGAFIRSAMKDYISRAEKKLGSAP